MKHVLFSLARRSKLCQISFDICSRLFACAIRIPQEIFFTQRGHSSNVFVCTLSRVYMRAHVKVVPKRSFIGTNNKIRFSDLELHICYSVFNELSIRLSSIRVPRITAKSASHHESVQTYKDRNTLLSKAQYNYSISRTHAPNKCACVCG